MRNALLAMSVVLLFCSTARAAADDLVKPYDEAYRPQFHFTPMKNWTNDPNGLVFYKGECTHAVTARRRSSRGCVAPTLCGGQLGRLPQPSAAHCV